MEELFATWWQSVSQNLPVELDQQQIGLTYQVFCASYQRGDFEKSDLDKFIANISSVSLSLKQVQAATNQALAETLQQAQQSIENILLEKEEQLANTESKKRKHHPQAVATLSEWFDTHTSNPYPSVDEKYHLSSITGMTVAQVETWFANTRRRRKV